jgi:hypothetical protein
MNAAASGGKLDCLKWAQSNGCNMASCVCEYAAREGHLELLIWARNNGHNFSFRKCQAAAEKQQHILDWMYVNY